MDKYYAPLEQPVFQLSAKSSWEKLTDKEKRYAHYLTSACWAGGPICLHQTSIESSGIFAMFQKVFRGTSVEELLRLSEENGVTSEEFKHFLNYAAAFYGNLGNYLSFGDTKFVPRISADKFRKILSLSTLPEGKKKEILELFDKYKERIYSLDSGVLCLALDGQGISTYYSPNVTKKDVEIVREFMQKNNISPYNTRLWKIDDKTFDLRKASAQIKSPETHTFNGYTINITFGDHSRYLQKVVDGIKSALPYAANENQAKMLEKYIAAFSGGDINDHKDSQRFWIKDIGPVVETNIGFIESYRDPEGERGEWEGFVACVNKEMTAKFSKLVEGAQKFIEQLPWPKEFNKDKFFKPDFTSLEVIAFASSGVPAGINIPNYDDIRQSEGFKNVSLGNVIAARSKDPIEFILPQDQELYDTYETRAFEVQVGIHELLGHGSGKLFIEGSTGKNFPEDLINPLTGKKIETWYKAGETWDSKFLSFASTMEECRAELSGLYLCTNKELLSIFGYTEKEADDIFYVNWLIMVRAGLRALEFFTPEKKQWGQAHMQARYAIFRYLLQAGDGLLELRQEKDNAFVVLDRSKILDRGMKAVGEFLTKLQIYKSTADVENGTKFYSALTSVPEEWIPLRDIVLSKKKPRRVFVQPLTSMTDGEIKYKEYEATAEGLIQSFVERFDEDAVSLD